MLQANVNLWAVLVAAIASMLIGMVWYSKFGFGKIWMALAKKSGKEIREMKKGGGASKAYVFSFIGSLVTAFILKYFVDAGGSLTLWEGAFTGFLAWLGFAATTAISNVLFEGKPFKLYLINSGYTLASFMAMGAILATWV